MNEIKIKKPVFITTLVILVLVLGGLIGLAVYDTIHIRNLESRSEAFTEGMMGPGNMGGRQGMMNGEMPTEFNGEAPELPEGEMPNPEGGDVTGTESDSSTSSSKPSRGSKTSE